MNPNFFIIGAPKCGTTSLAAWLAEHPAIYMSQIKEPHYFSSDLNHGSFRDRDKYLALFEGIQKEHLAVGEASVWYLYSEVAVTKILDEIPSAKFIVLLRNPTEMAPSLHEQMVFSGNETLKSFEEAWSLQDERRQGRRIPHWCPEPKLLLYKEACSLGEQVRRLYVRVPKERVLPILLDEVKADPRSVWLAINSFLRVPDDGRTSFPVENAAKERRSIALKRLNDIYADFHRRFSLPPMRTGIFEFLNKVNIRERPRDPLSPQMRQILIECFEDDIRLLEKLLNRDLEHWLS